MRKQRGHLVHFVPEVVLGPERPDKELEVATLLGKAEEPLYLLKLLPKNKPHTKLKPATFAPALRTIKL